MNLTTLFVIVVAILIGLWFVRASVKIVPEYERGVIFRLGRIQAAKGPRALLHNPLC